MGRKFRNVYTRNYHCLDDSKHKKPIYQPTKSKKMKTIKQIFAVMLIFSTLLSCEKDDKDSISLKKETISAKWVVDGFSNYDSFEFNESGNYIVVLNNIIDMAAESNALKSTVAPIIKFGTYKITDDKTIVLVGFGKIKITSIDESSFSFTFQLEDDSEVVALTTTRTEDMASSSRTDLLCRTWEMVTIDGVSVKGTSMELSVLFSTAGTYFVSYANPSSSGSQGGLAQWTWKDAEETTLCYSWTGAPTCLGENEVTIPELTSSKLKIIEDGSTYILAPASNSKSGNITNSAAQLKPGIFKKQN
jgi:hypothetical protein